jgi:hypothetical protein
MSYLPATSDGLGPAVRVQPGGSYYGFFVSLGPAQAWLFKSVNGTVTVLGSLAESDLNGNLQSEYVFFDGERIARRDNPANSGPVFYYFSDHLKTTDIVTDAQGNIKNESDFYPWGGEPAVRQRAGGPPCLLFFFP